MTEVVKDVVNKLICSEGCPLKSPMELPALLVACIMFPVIIYCYYRVVDFLIVSLASPLHTLLLTLV